jgi:hypothetical protein
VEGQEVGFLIKRKIRTVTERHGEAPELHREKHKEMLSYNSKMQKSYKNALLCVPL